MQASVPHLMTVKILSSTLHSSIHLDILWAPAHQSHLPIMSDANHTLSNGHCVSPESLTPYQVPHDKSQQPNGAGDAAFNGESKAFEYSAKDLKDEEADEYSAKDTKDEEAFEYLAKDMKDEEAFVYSAKDLKNENAFADSAKDSSDGEGFGNVAKDVNNGAPLPSGILCGILVRLGLRSRKISPSQLEIGDHITSDRGNHTYHHHGLYLGNDRVVHFTRPPKGGTKYKCYHGRDDDEIPVSTDDTTELRLTCVKCFMRGHSLYRYDHDRGISAILTGGCIRARPNQSEIHIVLKRAKDFLQNGKWQGYNLLYNNCETFAYYCKTGTYRYRQAVHKLACLGSTPT